MSTFITTFVVGGLHWFLQALMFFTTPQTPSPMDSSSSLHPAVAAYVAERSQEFDQITSERKAVLAQMAVFVREQVAAQAPVKMVFICTHNSRRSHFGQVWAAVAAYHYGIEGVETYSGGTEATACNPRTIAALARVGMEITAQSTGDNPLYHIRYAAEVAPVVAFSKKFGDTPNPTQGFCAVMTCTQADEACPFVPGALKRFATPYEDPKAFDGTPDEARMYDERCRQIARELLYVFSLLKK